MGPHLNYGGLSTVGTILLAVTVVGVVGVGIALVATHQKKQRRIRDALAANPPPPASSLQRHQPEASTAPLLPPAHAHLASPPAYGAVSQQSGRGGSRMTIENLLTEAKLSQYATAFNEAGCVEVDDIHDLADDDLQGIGLKGPEIKRLRRKVGVY